MFRSKRNDRQSSSDVIKDYNHRIEAFYHRVLGRKSAALKEGGDTLDGLFQWSENEYNERVRLKNYEQAKDEALRESREERDGLAAALALRDEQILKLQQQRLVLEEQRTRLVERHAQDLKETNSRHTAETQKLKETAKHKIEKIAEDHKHEVEGMKTDYDTETYRLRGQLLISTSEAKSWPDDILKGKFQDLETLVGNMTSPKAMKLKLPERQHITLDFDPTGFLRRASGEKAHLLFKNAIWSILYECFFALPLGFGVLGSTERRNPLLDAFRSWRRVVDNVHVPTPENADDFSIFRTNKVANSWRCVTFESALSTITCDNDGRVGNETAQLSSENLDAAVSQISSVFDAISQHVTSESQPSTSEIRKAAKLARDIAVQFGVNSTHLQLLVPKCGTEVQIGTQYYDYKNDAMYAGTRVKAELFVSPGLQKLGYNQVGEVSSVVTIAPCKICVLV